MVKFTKVYAIKRRDELSAEIEIFSSHFQLTPRETEIMGLLCVGTTRIKEIAEHLKLSPNTVNNHINSIFAKAKARSKSELMSYFLEFLIKRVELISSYARAPKILYLHDGSDTCTQTLTKLRAKGLWVEGATDIKSALGMLREVPYDLFISCHGGANNDWRHMIKASQDLGIYGPPVIAVGDLSVDLVEALDAGLADVLPTGSAETLYDAIKRHYVSYPFRPQKQRLPTKVSVEVELSQKHVGRGGVFLSKEILPIDIDDVNVGDYVELVLRTGSQRLKSRGQVVWRRLAGREKQGLGVRFTQLPADDVSLIFRLVRDHRIAAYIPSGRA